MIVAALALLAQAPPPAVPNMYSPEAGERVRSYGWCLSNNATELLKTSLGADEAFQSAKARCTAQREQASATLQRDELRWPWKTPETARASTDRFLREIEAIARSLSIKGAPAPSRR